jgi:hypothetical protein
MDFTSDSMDDICEGIDTLASFFKAQPNMHALMQINIVIESIVYPNDALRLASAKTFVYGSTKPPHKQKTGRKRIEIKHAEITALYGMPMAEAADALQVSATTLQRQCRRLGIASWPYRFERSILNTWSSV